MYGEVHKNRVFYRANPEPGHRYRQITLHELEKFVLVIGEGDVVRTAPDFKADSLDAEAYFLNDLTQALAEVETECVRAEQEGWIPYVSAA